MKKVLALLMSCSLLFMGCRHDDVLENDPNQSHKETGLKGKSFVLTQTELEAKYAGNKKLHAILENDFSVTKNLNQIKTVENDLSVSIDLDYIQVFESEQIHAITYHVQIGDNNEGYEPQEIYNLVYFSTDYENYFVMLLKYDFTTMPLSEFIMNPREDVYTLLPLQENDDIKEAIKNTIKSTAPATSFDQSYIGCRTLVIVPAQACQVCGLNIGEVKDVRMTTPILCLLQDTHTTL